MGANKVVATVLVQRVVIAVVMKPVTVGGCLVEKANNLFYSVWGGSFPV